MDERLCAPQDCFGDASVTMRREDHMPETIEILVSRLERTAAELRSGDLEPRHAAALVDDLARIAAEAGGELYRHVRLGDQPLGPAGQLAFSS